MHAAGGRPLPPTPLGDTQVAGSSQVTHRVGLKLAKPAGGLYHLPLPCDYRHTYFSPVANLKGNRTEGKAGQGEAHSLLLRCTDPAACLPERRAHSSVLTPGHLPRVSAPALLVLILTTVSLTWQGEGALLSNTAIVAISDSPLGCYREILNCD